MFKLPIIWRKAKNSSNPNKRWDSYLKFNKESEHFLSIFPELVWRQIIKLLDNNDLQNLSNSSPFFRDLLLDKRVHFLFGDVFKIVAPRLLGRNLHNLSKDRWTNEREVRCLLFNCRLVCRVWNTSLCSQAREISSNWNVNLYAGDIHTVYKFTTESYKFSSFGKIIKFLDAFMGSTRNPIFGETIFLLVESKSEDESRFQQRFYNQVLLLLQHFGKYVSNCKIYVTISVNNGYLRRQIYKHLMNILWAMPNLKKLRVENWKIEQFEHIYVPPTLQNMHSLELIGVSSTFYNAIISKNLQLSSLFVQQPNSDSTNIDYFSHNFENLTNFKLLRCHWNEIICLKRHNIVCWKLKSLKLQLKDCVLSGKNFPVWSELFKMLSSRLGETLEELDLDISLFPGEENKSKIIKDSIRVRLNLPKVKTLVLKVKNNSAFDFLLGMCESLERLSITSSAPKQCDDYLEAVRSETLEILSYYDRLYGSNIWELFPKLQRVDLQMYSSRLSYNRHKWNKTPNKRDYSRSFKCLRILFLRPFFE